MARSSLLGTAPVPHADEGSECGLTNNERKGFGFPAETVDDYANGVVLQAGYRSELSFQQPKVLSYDPVKLFSPFGPWRALCSPKTRRATVFSAAGLAWKHFSFFTIALVAGGSVGPLANQEAEDALENLNTIIAGGLFFLLGPFVGTACARMWSVRTSGVGALWGTVLNLSVLAAAWFHTGSVADRSARDLIKRLGLASHALLYKEARGEDNLDDLVHAGLLLPEEAQALAPLPSKGQVVWSWLTHFWARVLSGELDVTPVPHAATLQPMIMQKCLNGQDAIGTALTFANAVRAHLVGGLPLRSSADVVGTSAASNPIPTCTCSPSSRRSRFSSTPWPRESTLGGTSTTRTGMA